MYSNSYTFYYLTLCCFLFGGCYTLKINNTGFADQNTALSSVLKQLNNSDVFADLYFDSINIDFKQNRKNFKLQSEKEVKVEIGFANLQSFKFNKNGHDSLQIKANFAYIVPNSLITLRYKNYKVRLKKVFLDTSKNTINLRLKINPFKFFTKNLKREKELDNFSNPRIVRGRVGTIIKDIPIALARILPGDVINGCEDDLYINSWRLNGANKNWIGLSSRIRYEHWTCGSVKTRLLQHSGDVDYNVNIGIRDGVPIFAVEATDLVHVPGFVEDIIENWFSKELGKTVNEDKKITIPGYDISQARFDNSAISQTDLFFNVNFELLNSSPSLKWSYSDLFNKYKIDKKDLFAQGKFQFLRSVGNNMFQLKNQKILEIDALPNDNWIEKTDHGKVMITKSYLKDQIIQLFARFDQLFLWSDKMNQIQNSNEGKDSRTYFLAFHEYNRLCTEFLKTNATLKKNKYNSIELFDLALKKAYAEASN